MAVRAGMVRRAAPRTTLALDTRAPYTGRVPQPPALFDAPAPPDAVVVQVIGEPQPQGSMTGFVPTRSNGDPVRVAGGRIMVNIVPDNAKRLRPWRNKIKTMAYMAMRDRAPLAGPLVVEATFTLPKPKAAPKLRRIWPDKRPDLDKLLRALLDGLTAGGAYADDCQVVAALAFKCYPDEPSTGLQWEHALSEPGVRVRITRLAWVPGEGT